MKTAESIAAEWFKHSPKIHVVRDAFVTMTKEVQLDAMRYGMEQAARICEKEGGCYGCQYMLEQAAKTAQLP